MLNVFKTFLRDISSGARTRFEDDDYRVAAAALLVHAISIDGTATEAEHLKLTALVRNTFGLDAEATAELIAEATEAEHEAVDLYRFTSLISRALDETQRRRIIEMMWEVVLSDGRVTEFEDNLIWRVADLLHVPSRERIELRQRVAAANGLADATRSRQD